MDSSKDLRDLSVFKPISVLEESDSLGKRLRVRGLFQKVGHKNANGRIYPNNVWEKVLGKESSFMRKLKERKVLGELEHPESGNTHLARVSHLITNIWRDGTNVLGEAIVLKTPSGAILEELFKMGIPVGISSRGSGSTKNENDAEMVQEDYDLRTFDFVYDPSVEDAYPELVNESRERALDAKKETDKEESSMPVDVKDLLVRCGKAEESARSLLGSKDLPQVMEMNFALEGILSEISEAKSDEYKAEMNFYRSKLVGMKQMIADRMKILSKPVSEAGDTDPKKVIAPEGGDATKLPKDDKKLTPEKDPEGDNLASKDGKSTPPAESKVDDKKVVKEGEEVPKATPEADKKEEVPPVSVIPMKKYRTAVEVGEALTDIAASLTEKCKAERRARLVSERKLTNATKLLEAVTAKYKSETLSRFISDEVTKDPSLKAVESVLRKKSTTLSEAKEMIAELKAKSPASKVEGEKEPLPPVGGSKDGGKAALTEKSESSVGEGQRLLNSVLQKASR